MFSFLTDGMNGLHIVTAGVSSAGYVWEASVAKVRHTNVTEFTQMLLLQAGQSTCPLVELGQFASAFLKTTLGKVISGSLPDDLTSI